MSKPPILAGTLYKRGSFVQSWRYRYFVLDDETLTYYTRKGGARKGVFHITRATECEDASLRPFCFFLRNEERTLFLAADDMTQKDMWMEAVFSAIHIRRIGYVPGQSFDGRNSASSDGSSATVTSQSALKRVSMRRVEGIMKTARAKYQERPQLVVKIIQARNLLGKDMSGSSDPYVVCTVGSSTVRTTTRDKDLNPQWGMVFMFDFDRSMRYMKLEVWDEDQHTRDDFLGVVLIPLFNLPPNQKITRWYPLGKRSNKSHVAGDIEVEISCNKSLPYSPLRLFREVQALPEYKMPLASIAHLYENAMKAVAAQVESGTSDHISDHITHSIVHGESFREVPMPKFPAMFPPAETEMLEDIAVNVTLKSHTDRGGVLSHGLLLLTNYRLIFVSDSRMQMGEDEDRLPSRALDDLTTQLPIGMIASVALSTETNAFGLGMALGALRVQCRDARVLSFLFRDGGAVDAIKTTQNDFPASTEGRTASRTASRTKSLMLTPPWKLVSLNLFGRRGSDAPPPQMKTNIFSAPGAESAWTPDELDELEAPYADEGSPCQRFYHRLNLRAINRHNEVDEAMALHTNLLQTIWDGKHVPLAAVPLDEPDAVAVNSASGAVCETIPEEPEGAEVGSPPSENQQAPIHDETASDETKTAGETESSTRSDKPVEASQSKVNVVKDENPTAPLVDAVFGNFVSDMLEPENLNHVRRLLEDGWKIYDPVQEFRRMGIPDDKWRVSEVNAEYELCPTYPALLAVPRMCSDELLLKVAAFRSKGRLPALSWRHPVTKATICRCSQPLVGLNNSRSEDDEMLVSLIRAASGEARAPRAARYEDEPASPTSDADPDEIIKRRRYVIVDARPKINAQANQAAGKGFESVKCYDNCSLIFMNIGNIHVMRKSLELLEESCTATSIEDANWFHSLEVSGWLGHVHRVLSAAVRMVHLVSQQGLSVLVHCSDGWDRTAQLAGLAMLLMDPYYRTLKGFLVLIEKEWISFGHKFADRLGHGKDGYGSQDRSPIFMQFLDCVFQCINQAPSAFEFNEDLLLFICEHMHTGWFGTFLFNCERERVESGASKTTVSMWTYVLANEEQFKNPGYVPTNTPVVPVVSMKRIVLWHRWFLRWHDRVWQQAWKQNHEAFMEEEGPTFWLPDTSADRCYDCERPFTFYRRRHHCRSCGFIFCEPCACHLRTIPGIHEDVAVRVCLACSKKLDLATKLNQKHVMQYLASSNTAIRGVVLPHTASFRTTSDAPLPQTPRGGSNPSSLKRSMSFPPRDPEAAEAAIQPRISVHARYSDDDYDDDDEDAVVEEDAINDKADRADELKLMTEDA